MANLNKSDENFLNIKARKSIRTDESSKEEEEEAQEVSGRMEMNLPKHLEHHTNQRSNSEPPTNKRKGTFFSASGSGSDFPSTSLSIGGGGSSKSKRLNTINEDKDDDELDLEEEEENDSNLLSKSNSQLNESDLDMDGGSSCTPTPIPHHLSNSHNTRRINSETNLNESQRRLSGFMGNRSKRFCASTSELSFTRHLDTEKSLFSPRNNQNSLSRQSFNSSLYGSNLSLNSTNSKLFYINSPFYNGKTMFGGASAYPKRDMNLHKIRHPVQMRPSSSLSNSSTSSDTATLSNTAKRLLEIMNRYSSPSKDARKMGNNINSILKIPSLTQNRKRFGEEDVLLNRSVPMTQSTTPYGRPLVNQAKSKSPVNPLLAKPLQIPTMSQLLQLKRFQSSTESIRQIAQKSDSILNKKLDYKLPSSVSAAGGSSGFGMSTSPATITTSNSTSSSSQFKIKSNITKNLLRNDRQSAQESEIMPPLNLPEIKFPEMNSVPKIDIQLPAFSASSTSMGFSTKPITSSLATSSTSKHILNTTTTISNNNNHTKTSTTMQINFNSGSKKDDQLTKSANATFMKKDGLYTFSMPLKLNADGEILRSLGNSTIVNNSCYQFQKPLPIESDSAEKQDDKKASPIETKSAVTNGDSLFKNLVAQQKSKKWECPTCMSSNEENVLKCLCCTEPKPGSKPAETSTSPKTAGMFSQAPATSSNFSFGVPNTTAVKPASDEGFKKLVATQSAKWECASCMTRNDMDKDKCLCCETPKPGAEKAPATSTGKANSFSFGMPASVPIKSAADEGFKKLVANQSAKWECPDCMTRNDNDKLKCLCCNAAKPGASSSGSASAPDTTPKYSFGMPSSSQPTSSPKFSFGMPPAADKPKWKCLACMTMNDPSKSKCVCCEQPKPENAPENVPQFSFGSKPMASPSISSSSTPSAAPKFTFGMPPAVKTIDLTDDKEKEKEKDSEKPKDEVDQSKKATVPAPQFSFGVNSSTSETKNVNTATTKTTESTSNITASFTFKSPSSSPAVSSSLTFKPTSPALQKPTETKITIEPETATKLAEAKPEEPKKTFSFGATTSSPQFSFGLKRSAPDADSSSADKKVEESKKPALGGFSFGANSSSPNTGLSKTGGISFSGFSNSSTSTATTIAKITATPSLSTTTANEAKPVVGGFSFGSSSSVTPAPVFGSTSTNSSSVTPAAPVFGSASSVPAVTESTTAPTTTGITFGSVNKPLENKTFGSFGMTSSEQKSTPVFGQTNNASSTFSFSNSTNANADPSKPAAPLFVFGTAPSSNATENAVKPQPSGILPQSQPFVFGGQQPQQQQQTPSATPMFGASNATPTFGSFTNFNNNESGFGSKMATFGSSTFGNSTTAPVFGFGGQTNTSTDEPSTKKLAPSFEFGAQNQQPQTNAPFAFGGANNNIENNNTAFNFTATKPVFNFTSQNQQGISSTPSTTLFQFGASNNTSSNPSSTVFAFGANPAPPIAGAPPFQFGAPNPNPFAPQATGTQSAAAQRRKIKATRRLTPR